MYHISIQGKVIGTFNHNEVLRALGDGTFSEVDHYWKAGMIDWKPLNKFTTSELTVRVEPPSPKPQVVVLQENKAISGLEKILRDFLLGMIIGLLNTKTSRRRKSTRRQDPYWEPKDYGD